MIKSLLGLRYVFFIFIFLFHFSITYFESPVLKHAGEIGVTFFFILSGFVLAFKYQSYTSIGSTFIIKRINKIYPLYLLVLAGTILMSYYNWNMNSYVKLVPNVLLLQSWIPLKSFGSSGVSVSWFLSDLMFFYFIYKYILYFFERFNLKIVGIGILIWVLINVFLIEFNVISDSHRFWFFYICPISRLLDFVIGVYLCRLFLSEKFVLRVNNSNIVQISSLVILFIMFFLSPLIPQDYLYDLYFIFPCSLLIFIFALTDSNGFLSSFLGNKYMVKLGENSFACYLIHYDIVIFALYRMDVLNLQENYLIIFLIVNLVVATSLGFSANSLVLGKKIFKIRPN